MYKKNLLLVLVMIIAALGIAGCGDSADDPTDDNPTLSEQEDPQGEQTQETESADDSSSGQSLSLSADPNGDLKYNTDKLNANAGNITIALTNESSVPHDVAVEDSAGKVLGTSEEITQSDTDLELKDVDAGSYTFFCTVPGHKAAGMEGTLTVR